MMCKFCQQDVEQPCQDRRDIEQRAQSHVERCETALDNQDGTKGE